MVLRRLPGHVRDDGALPVLTSCLSWGARWLGGLPRAQGPADRTFTYEGREVPYFWHRYNHTWMTERAVEIALAAEVVAAAEAARTLEVGNVLRHYLDVAHDVVDKYERAPGVRNEDVVEVTVPAPVDLVVAISTLEHVGLDEPVKDRDKARRGIERLADCLAPGGRLWVTIPANYNRDLDAQLHGGELPFTRLTALRRVSAANDWEQVSVDEVRHAPYDFLVYTAHGLVVAELVREP